LSRFIRSQWGICGRRFDPPRPPGTPPRRGSCSACPYRKLSWTEVSLGLNPPRKNIPGQYASVSDRSTALLEWVESNISCRLETLEHVISSVMEAVGALSAPFPVYRAGLVNYHHHFYPPLP